MRFGRYKRAKMPGLNGRRAEKFKIFGGYASSRVVAGNPLFSLGNAVQKQNRPMAEKLGEIFPPNYFQNFMFFLMVSAS